MGISKGVRIYPISRGKFRHYNFLGFSCKSSHFNDQKSRKPLIQGRFTHNHTVITRTNEVLRPTFFQQPRPPSPVRYHACLSMRNQQKPTTLSQDNEFVNQFLLGIIAVYHNIQNQRNVMIQSRENTEKPQIRAISGPFCPILGQHFFQSSGFVTFVD